VVKLGLYGTQMGSLFTHCCADIPHLMLSAKSYHLVHLGLLGYC
jgi:hypothetical protein